MKFYLLGSVSFFLAITSSFGSEAELRSQIQQLSEQVKLQAEETRELRKDLTDSTSRSSNTSVGGYGEISFNHYFKNSSRSVVDLKRFVVSLEHRFSDKLSFNGEIEWEHAITSSSDRGESEIEQAFLDYEIANGIHLKTGLFLMPFGILNQSHEPPVFFGVERNEVETRIIPTTWREGGVGLSGSNDFGLDWDLGITTGFDIAKLDDASSPLRASHQELQLAKGSDPAFYGALNYRRIQGLLIGSALFTGNSTQGNADFAANTALPNLAGINGRITLWDVHTRFQKNRWDLQALYAHGSVGDADRIDSVIQAFNTATGGSRVLVPAAFHGWFIQSAYTIWEANEQTLTPFIRYEVFNTQLKMPAGFSSDPANADRVATVGLSYKPLLQVVFKADYQRYLDHNANDRFNLGMGYMF